MHNLILKDTLSPQEFHHLVNILVETNSLNGLNSKEGDYHNTPLHLAMLHIVVLKETLVILQENGIEFNTRNKYGWSHLHCAIYGGQLVWLLKKLVELGANADMLTNDGSNVLHWCAWMGHHSALYYFLEKRGGYDVNYADESGHTPLHNAMYEPKDSICKVVKLLVKNGADLSRLNVYGKTPLDIALNSGVLKEVWEQCQGKRILELVYLIHNLKHKSRL